MGILSKLWPRSAHRETQSHLPQSETVSRRAHERYLVSDRDLFLIEHQRAGLFRVVDISFNGCFLEPVGDAAIDRIEIPCKIEASVCGQGFKMEVASIQKRKVGGALVFHHWNEASMLSMAQILEPMRCGSTAIEIQNDSSRDGFNATVRKRYQGDGPVDLVVERDVTGNIIFVMVTVRRNEIYGSVLWENGEVVTKRNKDAEGVAARMAQTPTPDHDWVWYGALSCLGMKNSDGGEVAKLLTQWLNVHPR